MFDNKIIEDFPKNEMEFLQRFKSEHDCEVYLFKMRWPNGFICEKCGNHNYWLSKRKLYICKSCEFQHSITSGTIMHKTRKSLFQWFHAMWWFTTRKSGVNAVNLKDLLGLNSYQTAWTWLQKLRRFTIKDNREKLSGVVEVDEFYLGGQKSGKRGRGSEGKSIVVAAVEKKNNKIGRIRLSVINDCSSASLMPFIENNIEPGSIIMTDKWKGYASLKNNNNYHHIECKSTSETEDAVLPGVHLIASLVKRLIIGTFQGRFEKKYIKYYLDEYVFRFNRRKSKYVGKKFYRIVQQIVIGIPATFKSIVGFTNNRAFSWN